MSASTVYAGAGADNISVDLTSSLESFLLVVVPTL